MKILAIETSCDETAIAIVQDGREVLSSMIYSQIPEHKLYGGVVPEIAGRRHVEQISHTVKGCLKAASLSFADIDGIAVTAAPGLIGALLVGVNYAKGLALALNKPLIPVHHIRGHIAANYIAHQHLKPPFLCLVISGGHSHIIEVSDYTTFEILGKTRDDAVGEAFDKAARVMGFPYPGGIYLDAQASEGKGGKYSLPHPMVENAPLDFSFSGLKTAVINIVHTAKQRNEELDTKALCADFQEKVCEIINKRLSIALSSGKYDKLVLAGGVCANSGIRKTVTQLCEEKGVELFMPPQLLCTDNAAMIGAQAYFEYQQGNVSDMSLNANASVPIN